MIVAETGRQQRLRHVRQRLQWGRDLIVAETCLSFGVRLADLLLQWGRDLIVAETPTRPTKASEIKRFNGAAT